MGNLGVYVVIGLALGSCINNCISECSIVLAKNNDSILSSIL